MTPKTIDTVPILNADTDQLEKISRDGLLSLTLTEMKTIQAYFSGIGRNPTDAELETLAQTWSEHCVHKTFKGQYFYKEENLNGQTALAGAGEKTYQNLLKETIARATEELAMPWCLSVFKDNAGVIGFDDRDAVAFKVETHNHPSALEPYGGAGTGIGGVIRDVLGCGLGGKPVMNTDVFCFGMLDTPKEEMPEGALHPLRIARGVVSGVRDYGNRMGIPTGNGAVYFDPGYTGNPLVFCGTVGLMPRTTIDKHVHPGDLVVVVGGRTGRDGIHGATFSSAPLESGITSNVVQIGHAIMEKKFLDVLLVARDKGLYRSITDCGAGGFSSAIGELGQETGVRVNLEHAPLKYQGLKPWEIWLSESQERMVLAVPPENWNSLRILFQQEDVEAVVLGEFTQDKKLTVMHRDQVVAELDMDFLHNGVPKLQLKASWDPAKYAKKHAPVGAQHCCAREVDTATETQGRSNAAPLPSDLGGTLRQLLKHPVIASKERVIRQYDHEVQGGSIIKPLMGDDHDGPTDACVFRPKLNSWNGVGVSNGMNPEAGKKDPYVMAKMAVDEAYRNLISVGGGLKQVAILDNFCWGDAKDPLELAALVRAAEGCREAALTYKLPFISGKDSFNNTWKTVEGKLESIPPTLLVSAIGIIDDVRKCLSSNLKAENNLIYVVGETDESMGASLAAQIWGQWDEPLKDFDLNQTQSLYKKLQSSMRHKLLHSCHDISEGGIGVAAAEMAFGSHLGVYLTIPKEIKNQTHYLFSETPGRFLVEVTPANKWEFEQTLGQRLATLIGTVTRKPDFHVTQKGVDLFQESVKSLKTQWKEALHQL